MLIIKNSIGKHPPELSDFTSPIWGKILLQEASKKEQHRNAIKLLNTTFIRIITGHVDFTSIFLGTTKSGRLDRFFRKHEKEIDKMGSIERLYSFFEDLGILDRWWERIQGLFRIAFKAVNNSKFPGPDKRIFNLYNLLRQAKD